MSTRLNRRGKQMSATRLGLRLRENPMPGPRDQPRTSRGRSQRRWQPCSPYRWRRPRGWRVPPESVRRQAQHRDGDCIDVGKPDDDSARNRTGCAECFRHRATEHDNRAEENGKSDDREEIEWIAKPPAAIVVTGLPRAHPGDGEAYCRERGG